MGGVFWWCDIVWFIYDIVFFYKEFFVYFGVRSGGFVMIVIWIL